MVIKNILCIDMLWVPVTFYTNNLSSTQTGGSIQAFLNDTRDTEPTVPSCNWQFQGPNHQLLDHRGSQGHSMFSTHGRSSSRFTVQNPLCVWPGVLHVSAAVLDFCPDCHLRNRCGSVPWITKSTWNAIQIVSTMICFKCHKQFAIVCNFCKRRGSNSNFCLATQT